MCPQCTFTTGGSHLWRAGYTYRTAIEVIIQLKHSNITFIPSTLLLCSKVVVFCNENTLLLTGLLKDYRINRKRFAGFNFLRVPRKFSHKNLYNKHRQPRHSESIPVKNFIGLKLWLFSPVNLSAFMVCINDLMVKLSYNKVTAVWIIWSKLESHQLWHYYRDH